MRADELRFLFEYNYWARDRIMEKAAKLSPAQLIKPTNYGLGSMRNTLVHILSAEWIWRLRCQDGVSPTSMFAYEGFPTLTPLQNMFRQEEEMMRTYLHRLRDRDLERVVSYSRTGGEPQKNILWRMLVHVVNHGTEHRSVLAAELTAQGHSPGDLDIIHYLRATGGQG